MLSRRLAPQLNRTSQILTRVVSSVPIKRYSSLPTPQAPNYPTTWSTNQQPRAAATTGARFEQTALELQPNPPSAMELIANEPVRLVHGRKAGVALWDIQKSLSIWMHLDLVLVGPYFVTSFARQPTDSSCLSLLISYCGIRFEQAPHHH
ncbi:hypothetical protein C0992_005435 [Termitomyces sp. T32_za158]|nr:hypothetical protein C0992_005435 [Termitomyces sp. T32_za158]